MQHCRSPPPLPSMQSVLLPAASAKTGAARRDANGWGRVGSPDGLMLAVGDRGMCVITGPRWGKENATLPLQQLSLSAQGALLPGFLSSPPPSPAPFLLTLAAPSLSAKTIVTDYPWGSSRVRCRTPNTGNVCEDG